MSGGYLCIGDHDRLFKELLRVFFIEFLDLFLPSVRKYVQPDSVAFLDKEIFTDVTSGERHEADLVAQVRFSGQASCFLIHVENQAQARTGFGERMFRYFARLHEKYGMPVYPVVLFSYDTPRREEPREYRLEFPDKVVLEFRYTVIQLNKLNWREFVRHTNPVACALMAKMNVARKDRPKAKVQCLRLLVSLRLDPARMALIGGFVDAYLRLSLEEERAFQAELESAPQFEKEEVMEVITSWEQRGIEKGIQQGLHQGQLRIALRQLNHRIGEVEADVEARLRGLSVADLEEFCEALLDFVDEADVLSWLDRHDAAEDKQT